ncbi:hypothetical protein ACL598_20575 [Bordetella bronchialis]|uniref:hypothetical protein n=1 Tax=Bordetella bronchialis TaxID=463025 RepID=UPI003D082A4F
MMLKAVAACLTLMWASAGAANTELSAICPDPTGYQYRFGPAGQETFADRDGFKSARWSFFWNATNPSEGLTITQDSQSAGGAVIRHDAVVLSDHFPQMLTFLANFADGLWVYTLYPEASVLIASRHGTGFAGEGGVGGIFRAKCTFSIR